MDRDMIAAVLILIVIVAALIYYSNSNMYSANNTTATTSTNIFSFYTNQNLSAIYPPPSHGLGTLPLSEIYPTGVYCGLQVPNPQAVAQGVSFIYGNANQTNQLTLTVSECTSMNSTIALYNNQAGFYASIRPAIFTLNSPLGQNSTSVMFELPTYDNSTMNQLFTVQGNYLIQVGYILPTSQENTTHILALGAIGVNSVKNYNFTASEYFSNVVTPQDS